MLLSFVAIQIFYISYDLTFFFNLSLSFFFIRLILLRTCAHFFLKLYVSLNKTSVLNFLTFLRFVFNIIEIIYNGINMKNKY